MCAECSGPTGTVGGNAVAGGEPANVARPATSSVLLLRELAGRQGVDPTDEDLQAVLGFLDLILPALADLELRIPADTVPSQ